MTFIAFFRGINVGGNNVIPMAELRNILTELGCRRVATYIQSGNAVFQSTESDPEALGRSIAAAVGERAGFAPGVITITAPRMEHIVSGIRS